MERLRNKCTRFTDIANHNPKMVKKVLKAATVKPKIHQFEGHPNLSQDAFVDFNFKHNFTVVNYAPLGNMNLAYASSVSSRPKMLSNKLILDIAKARGCTASQMVLHWNLQRSFIVNLKAIVKDHMQQKFASLDKCKLEKEDVDKINSMNV
jgi:diketogulonate reductase-like aldo/keto reductase